MPKTKQKQMTNGEFIKIIEQNAIEYRKGWKRQLAVDYHMNDLMELAKLHPDYKDEQSLAQFEKWIKKTIPQEVFDAIIVDFINYIAGHQYGMDLAMYSRDLSDPNWRKEL